MTQREKNRLVRQSALIGEEACERLSHSSVLIAGIGGVGGHVAEALARMGIGKITLVDHDVVSESNINRQVIATYETIGEKKTDVMKKRILSINPDCEVVSLPIFITKENAAAILENSNADAVIDAVDNVTAKLSMICAAREQNRYIFSCMGTANKTDSSHFKVTDISKTDTCALARVMRVELRKRGITELDVLFSNEEPKKPRFTASDEENNDDLTDSLSSKKSVKVPPASVAYMPAIAGLMIAEHIFKRLTKPNSETE